MKDTTYDDSLCPVDRLRQRLLSGSYDCQLSGVEAKGILFLRNLRVSA